MAEKTLQGLQDNIAALFDQTSTAPTAGNADWNLRLRYLNRAQEEWVEAYNWPNLFADYFIQASTPTSLATLPLPRDFRKLATFPRINDGTTTYEYTEIRPEERTRFTVNDRYSFILGSPGAYNIIFNPGSVVSGYSINVAYYRSPASLASPANISPIPNPDYLVEKSLSYLFSGRDDTKRDEYDARATRSLKEMINYETNRGDAFDGRIKTWLEKKWGFRIGRDG